MVFEAHEVTTLTWVARLTIEHVTDSQLARGSGWFRFGVYFPLPSMTLTCTLLVAQRT